MDNRTKIREVPEDAERLEMGDEKLLYDLHFSGELGFSEFQNIELMER